MITRRDSLKIGGIAALMAPFAGFGATSASAQASPDFRFGIIADPQYAPVPPNPQGTRFYANSLWKLSEAIKTLNKEDLQFVATLGDIIDRHWQSFGDIMPLYDALKHEKFFLLGNHDYEVAADYLNAVVRTAGMPSAYYDFKGGNYRFIVLDGNDVSLFSTGPKHPKQEIARERLKKLQEAKAINAMTWNGSLSDEQFSWLQASLDKAKQAGEKVIVLCHYPVFPANVHNLWDSERIVDLLTSYDNFVAFFNGHNHAGNYGEVSGKYFVNFKGMVDTPDTSAFAVVEVFGDKIAIRGFGRETNRTLGIRAA
ncbi:MULTISPECIES: metallophosphoesterase [unclassified Chelatococcus]|jgi:3',5'-cyclic AMP phosphodiesterase CpdA|uniref:metallophosphoesterase n=1 Tax=unclassified Chelatococcus TaxID=2638111 RepID=UPI001BD1AFB6|nr:MULTISPECIES: metallophosphoesterase [unclassified Chelatococcus]CAH1666772.1 Calcineurin-like phosphoesterase family protein [Hyphomicrobiales bacterium]MBS7737896.1 metallophosphoesterase [Chelatococcus sp. HY11]MBX3546656.1 metallophosphoesterase [Chelatococcus sp.]MCO5079350.1 metallophosphoesterase [Chelatococcus sp.]CAH1680311.1 Calcineurin-like phosphoesterase family protein [Hyphomicrobiales bacterium]